MTNENEMILRVSKLSTHFHTEQGEVCAVDQVSFQIPRGKTVALVGESGCGKSVTSLSIMRLVESPPGRIASGEVWFEGQNLLALSEREMIEVRRERISMIFQEPMTSLNPVFRVGKQIAEALSFHTRKSKRDARDATIELLRDVGIPAPEHRVDDYPHQMSGGMRQRVMIAMALAGDPALLIADEPTTALDVTIQAQILDLLRGLQQKRGMSILLITHDLGVVAEMADEIAIMYAGQIVQTASAADLFAKPLHPYTVGLMNSVPRLGVKRDKLITIEGQVPSAHDFPPGCRFHPRCPHAMDVCAKEVPGQTQFNSRDSVACWLYDQKTMQARGLPAGLPDTVRT